MKFLQRVRCWEFQRLPLSFYVTPLSQYYNGNHSGCKDTLTGLISQFCKNSIRSTGIQYRNCSFSTKLQNQNPDRWGPGVMGFLENDPAPKSISHNGGIDREIEEIEKNVPKKHRMRFLVDTLLDLKDSKEAVYGTLDAWVAWERNFPTASLKRALIILEEKQEYHRVIQVIKWMLSKGQGTTMGTYDQLIHALDMDRRAEEAHRFWVKRIGNDMHSVPWQICKRMIAMYYRNNMMERLVQLFKKLEAFDRKPPEKSIVKKVADAYEVLGLVEEKERVLEKYNSLFVETSKGRPKKFVKALKKKLEISGKSDNKGTAYNNTMVDGQ